MFFRTTRQVQYILLLRYRASPFPASTHLLVCLDADATKSPNVLEEQRSSSRSLPAEIAARRPGFLAWEVGRCALLAVLDCLSGVRCGVGVTQIQFKIV